MPHTRVKICGVRRLEDVRAAVAAGADAIGLVFHPASPRHVEIEQARELARAVPPFVSVVGLFVDPAPEQLAAVLDRVPLGVLQFHGDEPPTFCDRWRRPYLKVLRMRAELEVNAGAAAYPDAAGVLLDSYRAGVPGGTGETFDWSRIPPQLAGRLVLAGGLSAANVGDAVLRVRPAAVDVSGGVERVRGVKDFEAIRAFVAAVRAADLQAAGDGAAAATAEGRA